jgi:hypothetical protein
MNKQIEEMVKTVSACECDCLNCKTCYSWELCEALYNAGYRKQTRGARKWVSVAKRLPEESGKYLVLTRGTNIDVLDYSAEYKLFNAFDDLELEINVANAIVVTHWMPLPALLETKGGAK